MRIVVDITHPCDINFFRAIIARLLSDGHDVELVYLNRGKVPALVAAEYPSLSAREVGTHASSRLGLYLRTGLLRELQLARALWGKRIDAVVGFPGFQTAMVAKLLGCKSLGVYDDPEHRPNMVLSKRFCDVFMLPEYLGESGANVRSMRGLKEWAYLSPAHFTPSTAVLEEYGLEPRQYVFVREVDPRSLNYMGETDELIRAVYDAGLSKDTVVLSLEDKTRRSLFDGWKILEEPVSDIHSLMYYSKLVVSSGDSMAREGAQLGVPSAYAGGRAMKANDALYEMGIMRQVQDADELIAMARDACGTEDDQQRTRQRLVDEWEDVADAVTEALYRLIDG